MMTSRERLLTALANGRPDRLPCQVHGWMDYYLKMYLGGLDWYQANERFGLDFAIYQSPVYRFSDRARANWRSEWQDLGTDADGHHLRVETVTTPKGQLRRVTAANAFTCWDTEHLLKNERDLELFREFYPAPDGIDFGALEQTRAKLGDRGIIRSHPYSPGQGSPWQSFCTLFGTEPAILLACDNPELLHACLESIVQRTLRAIALWPGTPADMVETGGGAGSNTVISPGLFREFCLPYDRRQNRAFHEVGVKVVYHLCGGLMKMLELVVESGADGLETMTPPAMGGDCDLREASRRVGDRLFFIGGFDQNAGFERGTPEQARRQVFDCFEATRDHAGFIIAPSDHFFFGDPQNLHAFADACKECRY